MEAKKVITNQAHLPLMSICGKRREISLGRVVIELMGCPCYVTIRISKNKDSLMFYPCKSTDELAIKVPDNLFINSGARVRIISKVFVNELLEANGMDPVVNYAVPGFYIEEKGVMVFKMQDAFKNHHNLFIESGVTGDMPNEQTYQRVCGSI